MSVTSIKKIWGVRLSDSDKHPETNSQKLLRTCVFDGDFIATSKVIRKAVESNGEWMLSIARRAVSIAGRQREAAVMIHYGAGYATLVLVDAAAFPTDLATVPRMGVDVVVASVASEKMNEDDRVMEYGVVSSEDMLYDHLSEGQESFEEEVRIYLHPTTDDYGVQGSWNEDMDRKHVFRLWTCEESRFLLYRKERSYDLEKRAKQAPTSPRIRVRGRTMHVGLGEGGLEMSAKPASLPNDREIERPGTKQSRPPQQRKSGKRPPPQSAKDTHLQNDREREYDVSSDDPIDLDAENEDKPAAEAPAVSKPKGSSKTAAKKSITKQSEKIREASESTPVSKTATASSAVGDEFSNPKGASKTAPQKTTTKISKKSRKSSEISEQQTLKNKKGAPTKSKGDTPDPPSLPTKASSSTKKKDVSAPKPAPGKKKVVSKPLPDNKKDVSTTKPSSITQTTTKRASSVGKLNDEVGFTEHELEVLRAAYYEADLIIDHHDEKAASEENRKDRNSKHPKYKGLGFTPREVVLLTKAFDDKLNDEDLTKRTFTKTNRPMFTSQELTRATKVLKQLDREREKLRKISEVREYGTTTDNFAPNILADQEEREDVQPAQRKPGRPRGSKNKAKNDDDATTRKASKSRKRKADLIMEL